MKVSVVIPAKNEESALKVLLPVLMPVLEKNNWEGILINDGSTDQTAEVAEKFGLRVISHPYSKGNGAAVKTGAAHAGGEYIVFMDADAQHNPDHIGLLVDRATSGFDMVIGSRSKSSQASNRRWVANTFYNKFASLIVGHKIPDLTSGFRAVNAEKFRQFLFLLPNGFSYPTTITMAFFRVGYTIDYLEIDVGQRIGSSHIRMMKDGIRFLLIIFKLSTLYSPLKIFAPASLAVFSVGVGYYLYTYLSDGRMTNMSVILFLMSLVIFLIGLVSEQVNMLIYQNMKPKDK